MPALIRALLLLMLAVCAQAPVRAQTKPFLASAPLNLMLKNAQWFDGAGFKRGTLYVVDGKFTATKPRQVHRSMDLKNQFIVPPLAEAHNYNLQNEWGADHFASRYVAEGVYYAAMLCADPASVDPIRSRFAQPGTPDVIFATACVTSSEGQPLPALLAASPGKTRADFVDKAVIVMDKPEDVAAKWPLVMARKTDMLRIVLGYSGKQGLSAETAMALTQRARKAGLRVIAHVETAADFDLAVRAGVDMIDHVPGYSQPAGEPPERFQLSGESAVQAARQKVSVITGMAAAQLFKLKPAQAAMHQRNLLILKEAGVNLLMGSDLFTETAQAELRALIASGHFSNEELLRMATMATPHALFPKRQIACFEPGCEASFLLLAEDPTQDIEALSEPLLRVKQGRLLTQDEEVAEAADDSSQSTEPAARKRNSKKKPAPKKKPATKAAKKP